MLLRRAAPAATRSFSLRAPLLSGHLKWQTIRHDKAKNDAKQAAVSNRLAGQITACVRAGGADANPQLQLLLEKARQANITKKVVEGAIARGQSVAGTESGVAAIYEALAPGGVAFVVEGYTDNKARMVAQVKNAFTRVGASMGSLLYMFERLGYVSVKGSVDDVFEQAIELGAQDVVEDEEGVAELTTAPEDVNRVALLLKEQGFEVGDVGIAYFPNPDLVVTELSEEHKKVYRHIVNNLEEIPDVTDFHTNLGKGVVE